MTDMGRPMQFNSRAHDQGAARRQAGNRGLAQFLGQGDSQLALSGAIRRQIMQALRKASAVMGPGQKSRIGRLGGGAALGVRATADNGRWSLSGGISAGRNSAIAASAGVDFVFGD